MTQDSKQFKIVTLVVPPPIGAVSVQGYSLEFKPAPMLGKNCHTVEVPMNLVQELKAHGLMTRDEWKAKIEADEAESMPPQRARIARRPVNKEAVA